VDPDLAAAWDELNDYLGVGQRARGEDRARGDTPGSGRGRSGSALPPESLRPDYANLEVPFGADIETVRRSYKRLVLSYHPDRHAGTPEKARVATEISKRINESFERIRSFQERTGTGSH
jgi:DnaJ-class molecular chaperone